MGVDGQVTTPIASLWDEPPVHDVVPLIGNVGW